jgi:ADP-ribose pyrophosphatase
VTRGRPQPWRVQSSEVIADCRIFKVRKDMTIDPRTGQSHEMFVLEYPDWVNVIPLTPDEEVVLVEQWRHGTRSVHLETPGGLMNDDETPEQCARRELLEETGYEAGSILRLGTVHPNPAVQANLQHYILAENCRKVAEPKLDHTEDIAVKLVSLADIAGMIEAGEITHGMVIGGLYRLLRRQKR